MIDLKVRHEKEISNSIQEKCKVDQMNRSLISLDSLQIYTLDLKNKAITKTNKIFNFKIVIFDVKFDTCF